MYFIIIILPLIASLCSGFAGRKIGISGCQIISCLLLIISTLLSLIAYIEVGLNNVPVTLYFFKWIDLESLNILWKFNFDSLTISMLIPVLIISSLVHIYSIGYMETDPHNQRFFSYLSLFTFMMILLVTANNFLLMFVGWEGVGICSYLLINFWFTRIAANQSSISAFLTNRVGDCFLTIGMFIIIWCFGNLDYATIFSIVPYINENVIILIGICFLIGAMAKSSQIGLHIWLPQAMEGPTPVSALIHAATMVTAGVYLLMRSSPLIEYSSTVLISCLWVGAITTIYSSIIGLFQQDIKRVIAYSTMSQLGMMVIAIGLSSYNIALFHLINHAFYKALLFLGAGAVIHAVSDNQDFRKYGGLKQLLPLIYTVMLTASLSLVAFPFMTGFYSKDFILESAYGQFTYSSNVVYYIATLGAIFTTLYSIKIIYLTFLTNPNGSLHSYKNAHESNIYMSIPLFVLAILSVFFGYMFKDIYIGLGSPFFLDNGIFIHPLHEIMVNTEFAVDTLYKLLPLIGTVFFSIITLLMLEYFSNLVIYLKLSRLIYNIFSLFNLRLLFEFFYNKYIVNSILQLGGQTTKIVDKGSVELLGPFGLERILTNLSKTLSKLDSGVVTSYALYILIGFGFYVLLPYLQYINIILILIIINLFINNLGDKFINYGYIETNKVNTSKLIYKNVSNKRFFSSSSNNNYPEGNTNQNDSNSQDGDEEDHAPHRLPHERPGRPVSPHQNGENSQVHEHNDNYSGVTYDPTVEDLHNIGSNEIFLNMAVYEDYRDALLQGAVETEDFALLREVSNRHAQQQIAERSNTDNSESDNNANNNTSDNNTSDNNPSGNSTSDNNNATNSGTGSDETLNTPTEFVAQLEQSEMPSYTDPED